MDKGVSGVMIIVIGWLVGWLFGFYGIVGYLTPKQFLWK